MLTALRGGRARTPSSCWLHSLQGRLWCWPSSSPVSAGQYQVSSIPPTHRCTLDRVPLQPPAAHPLPTRSPQRRALRWRATCPWPCWLWSRCGGPSSSWNGSSERACWRRGRRGGPGGARPAARRRLPLPSMACPPAPRAQRPGASLYEHPWWRRHGLASAAASCRRCACWLAGCWGQTRAAACRARIAAAAVKLMCPWPRRPASCLHLTRLPASVPVQFIYDMWYASFSPDREFPAEVAAAAGTVGTPRLGACQRG